MENRAILLKAVFEVLSMEVPSTVAYRQYFTGGLFFLGDLQPKALLLLSGALLKNDFVLLAWKRQGSQLQS